MKIEFSNAELVALSKALRFVKFQSDDYDAREFAGSPHIVEVYKRVCEAAGEYYKSINIPYPDGWSSIESIKGYLEVVKVHIKNTSNWNDLQLDQRDLFIKTLAYPYKINEQTIQELREYGDRAHL